MDARMLRYYSQELQYMREMGAEFAAAFPKIAARLALDPTEVADPYVERLLEGFSFLAARVRLKLDAEFPRFTQHLLECRLSALSGADAGDGDRPVHAHHDRGIARRRLRGAAGHRAARPDSRAAR